jgi:hypothetical protein
MQRAKTTHMDTERAGANLGRGIWPPASPWVWKDSWWDTNMVEKSIVLTWSFDDAVTGGGTLAFTSLAYDLDPQCPWEWLIVIKPNLTRITQQIPRGARTGTITSAQLAAKGLHVFTDIGSITVGSTSS